MQVTRVARAELIIPQTAVVYTPEGDSAFVVGPQRFPVGHARDGVREPRRSANRGPVAHQSFVRLGHRRGDSVIVASGLMEGETVVALGGVQAQGGRSGRRPQRAHPALLPGTHASGGLILDENCLGT